MRTLSKRIGTRWIEVALIAILALLTPAAAQAQWMTGAHSEAIGGAGRGSMGLVESAWLNPASLGSMGRTQLSTFFGAQRSSAQLGEGWMAGAAFVDAGPDRPLPGQLSWGQVVRTLPSGARFEAQEMQFSAGTRLNMWSSIGVGVRRMSVSGQYISGQDASHTVWNGSLGVLFHPDAPVSLGAVLYDVLDQSDRPRTSLLRSVPTLAIGGSAQAYDMFGFFLDWVSPRVANPENRSDVSLGLGVAMMRGLTARFGYAWRDTVGVDEASIGLGWIGPRLSFSYSLSQVVAAAGGASTPSGHRHTFDLWLPL